MTHQPQQEKKAILFGCINLISIFILWFASFYTVPEQWRWFVLLTFTVFASIKTVLESRE